jgi:hypothetical protein
MEGVPAVEVAAAAGAVGAEVEVDGASLFAIPPNVKAGVADVAGAELVLAEASVAEDLPKLPKRFDVGVDVAAAEGVPPKRFEVGAEVIGVEIAPKSDGADGALVAAPVEAAC